MTQRTVAASREEWLAARTALLEKEKAHARAGDDLAEERRALPLLRVEEDYVFEGPDGNVTLSGLFGDRSQLIVQHFMFGPDWEDGCPSCSFWADGYDPMIVHLNQRDVSFVAVSRAPLEKLQAYQERMGWSFPWVSSLGNRFNFDFGVSTTPEEMTAGKMVYNYRETAPRGDEHHGTSAFLKQDGEVYHAYSTYGRGLDRMNAAYAYLDIAPKGRDEGGLPWSMAWLKRHDEY